MENTTQLVEELAKLNLKITQLTHKYSYTRAFINGIFYGFGSVMGATIVVATILWILGQITLVPIIGTWLADIIKSTQLQLSF